MRPMGIMAPASLERRPAAPMKTRSMPHEPHLQHDPDRIYGTTILAVRRNGRVAVGGDGQVMDAIKLFDGQVGDDLVLKLDQFKPLRNKLLRGAVSFYGRLEALLKDQTDRASRSALGRAYAELANLTSKIGAEADAIAVFKKAQAVQQALASEHPGDPEIGAELARTLHGIGSELRVTGNTGDALAAHERAIALLDALPQSSGSADARLRLLAQLERGRAIVLDEMGDSAQAAGAVERSIALGSRLVESHPENPEFRADVCSAELTRGYLLTRAGKRGDALESQQRAARHLPEARR